MKNDVKKIAIICIVAIISGYLIGAIVHVLLIASIGYIVYLHKRIQSILLISNRSKSPKYFYTGSQPDSLQELEATLIDLRLRDQSRKKKIRNLLKEFREATKALPDSIIALDYQDCITWTNKSAVNQLGIKTPDDVGVRIINVLRNPKVNELLKQKNSNRDTIKINSPVNSDRYLQLSCVEYGKSNKLIVGRDITELEKAENVRAEFVANVSHELKTPITIFKGYIEELNQRKDDAPENWLGPMEEMEYQAKKMSQLVEELLLLSKLEYETIDIDSTEVDVCNLINQSVAQAKKLSRPRKHFYSLQTDKSLLLRGSQKEIYIIVSNIILNAARYTQNEGIIKIKWISSEEGNCFQVSDNGIGISQEDIPRITERFFRVNNSKLKDIESENFSNTGLGLALVKHCSLRNNGLLKIESTINKGSTFNVTFPFKN